MNKLMLPLIFLCLLLSACTQSIAPTQLQIPSLPPATPMTTVPAALPTTPTTVPTTTVPEPTPTTGILSETLTPLNHTPADTYNARWLNLEYPEDYLDIAKALPRGTLCLSPLLQQMIAQYPENTLFAVGVCFAGMFPDGYPADTEYNFMNYAEHLGAVIAEAGYTVKYAAFTGFDGYYYYKNRNSIKCNI